MEKSVQEKIDKIKALPMMPESYVQQNTNKIVNDGLLKAIRNEKEAAEFMAQLDALTMYAQKK